MGKTSDPKVGLKITVTLEALNNAITDLEDKCVNGGTTDEKVAWKILLAVREGAAIGVINAPPGHLH